VINILLLCTDQQRFDALGAAGNDEIDTPHLDRLARQGVVFDNCYVQSPVCGPSRASLMTGQYVHSHGLWANGVGLDPVRPLVSKVLANSGYDCGLVGKFHIGGACEGGRSEPRLDDGFRVFRWAHDPYPGSSQNEYHRWLRAVHPGLYEQARAPGSGVDFDAMPTEAHYSRWIAEETIAFLRTDRDASKPFFFIANFFDPHHGFGAPKEYVDRYRAGELRSPVTRPDELHDKPSVQTQASRESYAGHLPGFTDYTAEQIQEIRANYYAMVSLVDDEVGRILAALDEAGLADDTLVVFTSDHGEMLGDHQLMLKGPMMYEPAVRVPLILRWPGVAAPGARRSELVQWIDLTATLTDAAGLPSPAPFQGSSLRALAADPAAAPIRDFALCEYRNSGHPYADPVHTTMLRHGRHKIVVWHGRPANGRVREGELYDLAADPDELNNLWADPASAPVRAELTALLVDVLVSTEDRSRPRDGNW
jgi:arylsulfatase A-like enzyme